MWKVTHHIRNLRHDYLRPTKETCKKLEPCKTDLENCKKDPQHTATHCNTIQLPTTPCHTCGSSEICRISGLVWIIEALRRMPTHCNTLQHTATHCNTMQHIATHCNTLQHNATPAGATRYAAYQDWWEWQKLRAECRAVNSSVCRRPAPACCSVCCIVRSVCVAVCVAVCFQCVLQCVLQCGLYQRRPLIVVSPSNTYVLCVLQCVSGWSGEGLKLEVET